MWFRSLDRTTDAFRYGQNTLRLSGSKASAANIPRAEGRWIPSATNDSRNSTGSLHVDQVSTLISRDGLGGSGTAPLDVSKSSRCSRFVSAGICSGDNIGDTGLMLLRGAARKSFWCALFYGLCGYGSRYPRFGAAIEEGSRRVYHDIACPTGDEGRRCCDP